MYQQKRQIFLFYKKINATVIKQQWQVRINAETTTIIKYNYKIFLIILLKIIIYKKFLNQENLI